MNAHRRKEAKRARRRRRLRRESSAAHVRRIADRQGAIREGEERMEQMVDAKRLVVSPAVYYQQSPQRTKRAA